MIAGVEPAAAASVTGLPANCAFGQKATLHVKVDSSVLNGQLDVYFHLVDIDGNGAGTVHQGPYTLTQSIYYTNSYTPPSSLAVLTIDFSYSKGSQNNYYYSTSGSRPI